MSQSNFNVNISPKEAFIAVHDAENADLVFEEFNQLDDGRQIGILVFEKYYFRSKNRAALTVIMSNFTGVTSVRVVATGSSEGLIFNFDWGAADNFVRSVEDILADYII